MLSIISRSARMTSTNSSLSTSVSTYVYPRFSYSRFAWFLFSCDILILPYFQQSIYRDLFILQINCPFLSISHHILFQINLYLLYVQCYHYRPVVFRLFYLFHPRLYCLNWSTNLYQYNFSDRNQSFWVSSSNYFTLFFSPIIFFCLSDTSGFFSKIEPLLLQPFLSFFSHPFSCVCLSDETVSSSNIQPPEILFFFSFLIFFYPLKNHWKIFFQFQVLFLVRFVLRQKFLPPSLYFYLVLYHYQFYFVLAQRLKNFCCQFLFALHFQQQFEESAYNILSFCP